MSRDPPTRIFGSSRSAIDWFEKTRINRIKWVEKSDASKAREGIEVRRTGMLMPGPVARVYLDRDNRPPIDGTAS